MAIIKKHSLQFPDQFGMGNDYQQEESYIVPSAADKNGVIKSTYRDGIYTKLAQDVKDPEGFNKRTVINPQSAWAEDMDQEWKDALSGETDGLELFSDGYATATTYGGPSFSATPKSYYTSDIADNGPTGIDVADFRKTLSEDELV